MIQTYRSDIQIQTHRYRHTDTDTQIQTYRSRHTDPDIQIQTYGYRHTHTDIHIQTFRHTQSTEMHCTAMTPWSEIF